MTLPLGSIAQQEADYQLSILRRMVRSGDDLLLEQDLQHYRSHLALRSHAAAANQLADKSARKAKKAKKVLAIANGVDVGKGRGSDGNMDGDGENENRGDYQEEEEGEDEDAATAALALEAAEAEADHAQKQAAVADHAWMADHEAGTIPLAALMARIKWLRSLRDRRDNTMASVMEVSRHEIHCTECYRW